MRKIATRALVLALLIVLGSATLHATVLTYEAEPSLQLLIGTGFICLGVLLRRRMQSARKRPYSFSTRDRSGGDKEASRQSFVEGKRPPTLPLTQSYLHETASVELLTYPREEAPLSFPTPTSFPRAPKGVYQGKYSNHGIVGHHTVSSNSQ